MERTAMSHREFVRAAILRRVVKGELSIREATPLLDVSYRQAKRLVQRFRVAGAKGLVHGNVGRRSNRRAPEAHRDQVLGLVRAHYGGTADRGPGQRFGPTLAAEHLWLDHGLLVPVSTLARWMRDANLWDRSRRHRPRHQRRERRGHFGELVQLDGSFHEWFEGRGPRACVMTMVDDATGRTLLRFGSEETIWAAAGVLQLWIAAHGVPRALYTDWKNVYLRSPTNNELARGEAPLTHFGRMCFKLGIELIGASSPQAKGRVERGHGTHQDRLIKKLRLQQIADVEMANRYVDQTYLPEHNARFAVQPTSAADYHLPRDRRHRIDADIFCLEAIRVIGNDHVVQYNGRDFQLNPTVRSRIPVKARVLVREASDGGIRIVHVDREGRERLLPWTEAVARTGKRRSAPQHTPPAASPIAARPTKSGSPVAHKPAPNHPWRQYHERSVARAVQRRAAREARLADAPREAVR
jgi:transposase